MSSHLILFIGGPHRGGTGMVRDLILSSDNTSGFVDTPAIQDEGQFLQTVYETESAYGGPGRYAFNEDAHYTENHPTASKENAEMIFNEWSPYWDLSKEILLEKNPSNILKTRYLQKLFPNSAFLMVYRHPLAVAYATRKWTGMSVSGIIDHTLRLYEIYGNDKPMLKKSTEIRYEDLIHDGLSGLVEKLEQLGIKITPNYSNFKKGVNDKYFDMYLRDKKSWLRSIRERLWGLEEKFEVRLNKFGYSILDLEK